MTMTCPVGGHEGVGKIVKLGPGVTNLKEYTCGYLSIDVSGDRPSVSRLYGGFAMNVMNVEPVKTRCAPMLFLLVPTRTEHSKNMQLDPLATSLQSLMALILVYPLRLW
jgi:threonine dehydrogenase-like Zn-dependent dehydrogenase